MAYVDRGRRSLQKNTVSSAVYSMSILKLWAVLTKAKLIDYFSLRAEQGAVVLCIKSTFCRFVRRFKISYPTRLSCADKITSSHIILIKSSRLGCATHGMLTKPSSRNMNILDTVCGYCRILEFISMIMLFTYRTSWLIYERSITRHCPVTTTLFGLNRDCMTSRLNVEEIDCNHCKEKYWYQRKFYCISKYHII